MCNMTTHATPTLLTHWIDADPFDPNHLMFKDNRVTAIWSDPENGRVASRVSSDGHGYGVDVTWDDGTTTWAYLGDLIRLDDLPA